MLSKGTLFIIAAPSGGGKTSLVTALCEKDRNIIVSISHTTRVMRPGEKNGVNYHFVDEAGFIQLKNNNQFLEDAIVFGNHYGTSKKWVEDQLQQGKDVILEIDWQGAQQVREKMPDCKSIFILPPSKEVLEERLRKRAQDNAEVIAARMAEAVSEISHYDEFDYLVVNDDFEQALHELHAIIHAQRVSKVIQIENLRDLINTLRA